MFRTLAKLVALASLAAIAGVGIFTYQRTTAGERKVEQLEQSNKVLASVVERLSSDARVADIVVTGQTNVDGKLKTTLLFVATGRNGDNLPPRSFTIDGDTVHVEAQVIEFRRDLVKADDALRGHAVAMFTRLFGDFQSPADAYALDPHGQIPEYYRGVDPAVPKLEEDLWAKFWQLTTDEKLRQEMGVHVAAGKGVWNQLKPGYLYTLTIQPDGNLSSKVEQMPGIYREMLKAKS